MSYIFGPVPSRRLGRSLGIDLAPFKTCTYDCIYCQLGRTTCKTMERREWMPLDKIVAELKEKLDTEPDYITLGGSGEPTLHSRLDELIAAIRSMTAIPIAVITNGSLL
ncbi:MAG: radical SAM protein, partial [Victivallales bacterium]